METVGVKGLQALSVGNGATHCNKSIQLNRNGTVFYVSRRVQRTVDNLSQYHYLCGG